MKCDKVFLLVAQKYAILIQELRSGIYLYFGSKNLEIWCGFPAEK